MTQVVLFVCLFNLLSVLNNDADSVKRPTSCGPHLAPSCYGSLCGSCVVSLLPSRDKEQVDAFFCPRQCWLLQLW